MSETEASPTEQKVIERVRRYAQLRAAQRAVSPALRFRDFLATGAPVQKIAQQLRDQLEEAREQAQAVAEGESREAVYNEKWDDERLAVIDEFLNRYALKLHETVDRTPLAQFRATLPATAALHRDETVALLEVCLERSKVALRRMDTIDYLVTLLACDIDNGMRRVVRDPTQLCPQLATLCEETPKQLDDDGERLAEQFRRATQQLADLEQVASVVDRVRTIKQALGRRFFLPVVLDSVVRYNVAITNQLQELIERDRELDKEFLALLDNR